MRFTFSSTFFIIFLLGFLAITPMFGQVNSPGSLEGRVVDAETQQPVIGAIISLELIKGGLPPQKQQIGPTGQFRFALVPGKDDYIQTNYYIRTAATGYLSTNEKFIVTSGSTTRISNKIIYLKKGKDAPAIIPPVAQAAPVNTPVASATTATQTKPLATSLSPDKTVGTMPISTSLASFSATAVKPNVTAQTKPSAITQASAVTPPKAGAITADAGAIASTKPISTAVSSASATASVVSRPTAKEPTSPPAPVTAKTVQTQLRAMQFVQSKAELLPESQVALDQLLTFMRENPTVSIELAGHTDNQGDFNENLTLSRQRVELVKTFLIQNGIAANRISSRGYGSTRPIASNNSEATRRLNRRVEMIILTK